MLKIDREKYLSIVKSQGVGPALTALHHDTNVWEIETFEGENGYEPAMWHDLEEVRNFSRELWEIALQKTYVPPIRSHG